MHNQPYFQFNFHFSLEVCELLAFVTADVRLFFIARANPILAYSRDSNERKDGRCHVGFVTTVRHIHRNPVFPLLQLSDGARKLAAAVVCHPLMYNAPPHS